MWIIYNFPVFFICWQSCRIYVLCAHFLCLWECQIYTPYVIKDDFLVNVEWLCLIFLKIELASKLIILFKLIRHKEWFLLVLLKISQISCLTMIINFTFYVKNFQFPVLLILFGFLTCFSQLINTFRDFTIACWFHTVKITLNIFALWQQQPMKVSPLFNE